MSETSPSAAVDGTRQYRGLSLDPFQREAIDHVEAGRSVLVSAPTGTGKTLIADYIVEKALRERKDVIYTAPVKALSNQKYRDYCRLYGDESVGLITGDLVINRDAPLRIMTTEILRNMLLAGEELPHLAYVIIDEIHFLDDIERGTVWEEVLIYLPTRVKVLGLSATLANIHEFSAWLSHVRREEVPVVIEDTRHVPLSIFLANRDAGICDIDRYTHLHRHWQKMAREAMREKRNTDNRPPRRRGGRGDRSGRRLRMPGQRETRHYELVHMLGAEFRPILFFVFSRKMTEKFARELARKVPDAGFTTKQEATEIKAAVDAFDAQYLKVMTSEQEAMYLKGIAFHHAGLHVGLKAFVEELYERRLIKVLYTTSTFALGINMPARTVCFQALRKYDGRQVVPLTVRQFMQKAGRAGRRGIDDVGYVVILEEFEEFAQDQDAIRAYIKGDHEKVHSAFNLSFNSVINLIDRHGDLDAIRSIIDRSFLNFRHLQRQRKEHERLEDIAHSLRDDGWDPEAEDRPAPPRHLVGRAKRYRKLARTVHKDDSRVYDQFLEKVEALKQMRYLKDDLGFNAGARVLRHVQIEEIFSTELVLSGLLDGLAPALVFGCFCALSNEFSRTTVVRVRPRGDQGRLARELRAIRFNDNVRLAEQLSGLNVTFCPEMLAFGQAWYEGASLNELMLMLEAPSDISGDLVSGFRRAKDMAMQMRKVFAEDPFLIETLRDIARTVSRDEVEVVD